MPMYTYLCPDCITEDEVMKPMSEYDRVEHCSNCGSVTNRNFQADLPHTAADRYDTPIISDAMAINPEQTAEHKRLFPDIELTKAGQPIFDKFSKHEAYLKKCNYAKTPKKGRLKGKAIPTKPKPTPTT